MVYGWIHKHHSRQQFNNNSSQQSGITLLAVIQPVAEVCIDPQLLLPETSFMWKHRCHHGVLAVLFYIVARAFTFENNNKIKKTSTTIKLHQNLSFFPHFLAKYVMYVSSYCTFVWQSSLKMIVLTLEQQVRY